MKLKSFCRILNTFPAPVIPIFSDDNGDNEYTQVIDDSRVVEDFSQVHIADRKRIIIDGSLSTTERSIGKTALYGLAIDETHVIAGTFTSIKTNITRKLDEISAKNTPFSLLDIAMFLQDEELILSAAIACREKLERVSPSLTQRWLTGSPLSDEMKARVTEVVAAETEDSPDIQYYRFGFTGPWIAMSGITTLCNHHATYRSDFIRAYFEDIKNFETAFERNGYSGIDKALKLLLDLDERWPSSPDVDLLAPSRGSVYLMVSEPAYFHEVRNHFRGILRHSAHYKRYRSTRMFSGGAEHLSFLMILALTITVASEFVDAMYHVEQGDNNVVFTFPSHQGHLFP